MFKIIASRSCSVVEEELNKLKDEYLGVDVHSTVVDPNSKELIVICEVKGEKRTIEEILDNMPLNCMPFI